MPLNEKLKTSIIVPTYNGAAKITSLLKALASQTYNDFELIVVIDGSTDNTSEIVTEYTSGFQQVRVIKQVNKSRAAARNTGATAATGNLLIFFDDDTEPVAHAVEFHIRHHQTMKGSILGGHLLMDIRNTSNDFYQYRYAIEQKWDSVFPDKLGQVSIEKLKFTSQNFSVPAELFLSLNGFDERLSDSEDFDFCMRALLKQIPVYYDKNIFAWHRDYADVAGYVMRQKEYKHSKVRLLKLHPEYYQLHPRSFAISQKKISSYKRFVTRFFIYNFFWKYILRSIFFLKVIPKKIRFRLYEVIIYSSNLHEK